MKSLANFLLWVGLILGLLGFFTTAGFYFSSLIHIGVSDFVSFVDIGLLTLRVAVTGSFYLLAVAMSALWLELPIGLDLDIKDVKKA